MPRPVRKSAAWIRARPVYWNVDISRDGKHVLSGSNDGKLNLWDADTGNLVRSLDACKAWRR